MNLSRAEVGSTEFDRFRKFLISHSGISLADNKHYLVNSRLNPILKDNGLGSVDELLDSVLNCSDNRLIERIVDAMTTNETFWFRDAYFYDFLESELLPELLQDERKPFPLRIWSAGSSSGQEAYSASITVEQCVRTLKMTSFKEARPVEIIGTDISRQMVEQASDGVYSKIDVSRGLPENILNDYFTMKPDGTAQVKPDIKNRASFRVHNLQESFSSLGLFEIVMCRNVLIYFDPETVREILIKIHGVLRSGGVLFLSASEALHDLEEYYEPIMTNPGFMYRAKK